MDGGWLHKLFVVVVGAAASADVASSVTDS